MLNENADACTLIDDAAHRASLQMTAITCWYQCDSAWICLDGASSMWILSEEGLKQARW